MARKREKLADVWQLNDRAFEQNVGLLAVVVERGGVLRAFGPFATELAAELIREVEGRGADRAVVLPLERYAT